MSNIVPINNETQITTLILIQQIYFRLRTLCTKVIQHLKLHWFLNQSPNLRQLRSFILSYFPTRVVIMSTRFDRKLYKTNKTFKFCTIPLECHPFQNFPRFTTSRFIYNFYSPTTKENNQLNITNYLLERGLCLGDKVTRNHRLPDTSSLKRHEDKLAAIHFQTSRSINIALVAY